ncbi:interleukin-15 receptor subunit alpha [Symphorus nematophorus]
MDHGSSVLLSVCVMMFCLLGAARCSNGDENNCCPEIPQRELTETPQRTCFQIDGHFRYTCIKGFVRQAGTSNRIICVRNAKGEAEWTKPSLTCIPDPKIKPTTQPPRPNTTTATACLQTTQSISIPASVTAETDNTEPTRHDVRTDHTHGRETEATDKTTSILTTAEPSGNNPKNHLVSEHKLDSTTTAVIAFVLLVVVCALIGISCACYRKRRQNGIPPHTAEEGIAMNDAKCAPAS